MDGNACPVVCPAACGVGEMNCPAGMDSNGCTMPDTCISMNGKLLTTSDHSLIKGK